MAGRKCVLAAGLTVLFVGLTAPGQGGAEECYAVKPGDSLYAISRARGISVEALRKANTLKTDRIKPQQVLLIPTPRRPGREGYLPTIPDERGEEESLVGLQDVSEGMTASARGVKKVDPRLEPGPEGVPDNDDGLGDTGPVSYPPPYDGDGTKAPPAQTPGKWEAHEERSFLVRVAKTFLGVPYRLGGSTLRGLDCSALVRSIYEIFEISLPRTVREQFGIGRSVSKDELEEGDLVFFKTRRSYAGHVGIYIGKGEFVHASSHQRQVKVDRLDAPYFSKRFLRGIRVKELERNI
jgi:peptidoglycan endopeptidase LytE